MYIKYGQSTCTKIFDPCTSQCHRSMPQLIKRVLQSSRVLIDSRLHCPCKSKKETNAVNMGNPGPWGLMAMFIFAFRNLTVCSLIG